MAMLKRENSQPASVVNAADAHTILGREARFSGKLTFEGAVRIDGHFEGEIFTEDLLIVGPNAEVRATLNVGSVVINGVVEGDIIAKVSVEVRAPGRLRGNIVAPALLVEKGVMFDGSCRMSEDAPSMVRPLAASASTPELVPSALPSISSSTSFLGKTKP